MSDVESVEIQADLSNPDVVTKYKEAATIANKALAAVVEACVDGAKVVDVANVGDSVITKEAALVFNAKKGGQKIQKGVAFPTCVSINSTVGHFSPLGDDATVMKAGDVVKIDLGAHIDGFIATEATTIVVGGSAAPITGRAADVIQAARSAFDAALRLIRPGHHVSEVAPVLNSIAEAYGCTMVEGVMSHQMSQFIIDGNKCVLNRPSPEAKVDDVEFEENEVYAIDIVVSTGEGKPRVLDEKATTVYKRALDMNYNLKLRASRAVFALIDRSFPAMPFTLRALAAEAAAEAKDPITSAQLSLGLKEAVAHGLLHSYPVLVEKGGELVAQIKGTVLLMPNGSDVVTKAPAPQVVTSEKKLEDAAILDLLAQPIKKTKKKNKDKKKEEATA